MSDYPVSQPTPVAAPTAVPNYDLPNLPANTYQLLSSFADAVEIANTKINGHASKLSDISRSTNNAVTEVTSSSKGQATDTLSTVWQDSQTDLNIAHNQLATITTYPGGLGGGNQSLGWSSDFRTVLDENRAAIQTGLIALENLQNQQRNGTATVPMQQLEQWKQEVDALNGSIMNVNMAVEGMAMAIRNLNNGFSAACATGFTPGGPIPLFTNHAFASQIHGGSSGSGDGKVTEKQLTNEIRNNGGSEETAEFLPLLAVDHGLSLDNIKALLDTGIKPEQVYAWLEEDTKYKITDESLNETTTNVTLLLDRGAGDATQTANWLEGLNVKQLTRLKNLASDSPKFSADNLKNIIDPELKYERNIKHDVIREGVGPQPSDGQRALNNSVTYKPSSTARVAIDPQTEEIVVLDDTNDGMYHGHVEPWKKLDADQKNALINNRYIDDRGRVIQRDGLGRIIGYGKNVTKGK